MRRYRAFLMLVLVGLHPGLSASLAVHTVLGGIDMYNPVNGSQHSDAVTYSNRVV